MNADPTTSAAADPAAEEIRLEQAIAKADQILLASLKHDEQRRRWRFTFLGGIIMLAIACTIVAVLLSMGQASSQEQAAQKAQQAAQKAASQALNADGWKLFQKRDLVAAEAKFNDAVTKDPANAAAWNGLGWSRLNQGKRDEAEQAFTKCTEVDPKNAAAAYNGLGYINFGKQKYDEAEKAWLKSNGTAAWDGLAQLYLLQSKWDEALKYANKSLLAGDQSAKEFADAAKAKHLSDELRQKIEPAAEPAPPAPAKTESPDATNLAKEGWQFWKSGDYAAAEEKFAKAVEVDPKMANAWNGLGWSRFNGGKADEAISAFQKCLALMPKHPAALNGLGQIYLTQGRLDEAEKLLSAAASQNASAAWWGLAKVYLLQSKWEQAQKWAQKIVDSGDATGQPLLDAAKEKKLDDALREMIAPATQPAKPSL